MYRSIFIVFIRVKPCTFNMRRNIGIINLLVVRK